MRSGSEAPVEEPQTFQGPGRSGGSGARVDLSELAHRFGELEVIAPVDLTVAAGEVVGIVGPSGCGKSTLLELIAGLAEPTAGSAQVAGKASAADRLARSAYMPQRDLLLPWLAAIDNAGLALRNRGASRSSARAEAAPLFERFGLAGFEHTRPSELSGGMRQRVAFLRTLLAGKPLLLLDEPFASLDAITRAEMQEWLAGALAEQSRTIVLVSHDVEEVLYLADRVLVLSARPAKIVTALVSPAPRATPRLEAITSPAFTKARERALAALFAGKSAGGLSAAEPAGGRAE